jgi:uncharacterized protein with ParB-like and HNH nuclease domain
MIMIERANNIPVEKLLGKDDNNRELIYKIPPYQREYAWGKDQWENLFNDINDNDLGYFLGSIICIDNAENLDVIDGQQRLTTVSILLNGLLSVITEYNKGHPEDKILDLGENEEFATMWSGLKKYLFSKDAGMRLTLSIQNQNNYDYEYLLSINSLMDKRDEPKNLGNRRIKKAYEYFKSRLLEIDEDQNPLFSIADIFIFLKKLTSAMVVKIDVKDIASAFTLFESINNRGMPLTPIDLIKNSIIGKMDKDPEKTNNEWQIIVKNIEGYDDQVRFLRHYYHAFQNNDKIKITPYVKATKSNIMKIYVEHIKNNVGFIFKELIEKSYIYTLFVQPEKIDDSKFLKYKNKLIDVKRLGIAPSYSLLLHIFVNHEHEDFTPLLNFLEDWFIRRHLTDYPATNKLDQIFLDLIGEISKKPYDFEVIKKELMIKERYKNDEEFKYLLINGDLYTVNTGATRCLLTKLEKSMRTKENEVDFWSLTDAGKLIWSIEHILPQNPDAKSNWSQIFTDDDKKNNVHRLGNLTLTCYNSTLSNKAFEAKSLVKDTNENDIGLKSSNVKINNFLENIDSWDKSCIDKRSELLADSIIALLNNLE